MELSDLLEVQKKSYNWFLEEGIKETFEELFPVESFTGNVTIDFGDYSFDTPRYSIKESKERMVNYAAPLKVQARVFIHETGEVKEQEIFLGQNVLLFHNSFVHQVFILNVKLIKMDAGLLVVK